MDSTDFLEKQTPAPVANATSELSIGNEYNIAITGFTYIKDYAMIKGTIGDHKVGVIIGDKQNFSMRDMFELKNAGGVRAKYSKDKIVNNVTYKQFQLQEILF